MRRIISPLLARLSLVILLTAMTLAAWSQDCNDFTF